MRQRRTAAKQQDWHVLKLEDTSSMSMVRGRHAFLHVRRCTDHERPVVVGSGTYIVRTYFDESIKLFRLAEVDELVGASAELVAGSAALCNCVVMHHAISCSRTLKGELASANSVAIQSHFC